MMCLDTLSTYSQNISFKKKYLKIEGAIFLVFTTATKLKILLIYPLSRGKDYYENFSDSESGKFQLIWPEKWSKNVFLYFEKKSYPGEWLLVRSQNLFETSFFLS